MNQVWISFFLSAFTVVAQTVAVSVKPLVFPGLSVARATERAAQAFVSSALGERPAPELTGLVPYSLVLENNTRHIIRAYVLRLAYVDARGVSGGRNRIYFNFDPVSNGMEVPPGATRLVTPSVSFDRAPQTGQRTGSTVPRSLSAETLGVLQSQVSAVLSMDLIVFDNGEVIGPDESNALSYLKAYLRFERETALFTRDNLLAGEPLPAIHSALQAMANENSSQQLSTQELIVRSGRARRLLLFAQVSREDLANEVNRVLSKPPFQFSR